MSPKRKKFLTISALTLGGLAVILVVTSILIFQSAWFSDFVRQKIIAIAQESTGGTVEIGSFQFDWRHLTVRIRNFVLHGTEPPSAKPLLSASMLELRLKLLAGLKQAVDLEYLGIQQPQVDLIVFPDGKTNVPEPKTPKKPSDKSGLQTVVDLAVHQFEIKGGLLVFSQQKTAFNARGENLRVLLNYNLATPSYQGTLSIDPLLLTSGSQAPLPVHVNLPILIEGDAVTLQDARLTTAASQLVVSAELRDLNSPNISARVNGNISLAELQKGFALPIDALSANVPHSLMVELKAQTQQNGRIVNLQTAHLGLGQTTFQASGNLEAGKNSVIQFNGNMALAELERLLKIATPQATGDLQLNGKARLDAHNNYAVDGTLNSHAVSVRSGTTQIQNVSLYSPFHADPYLISLDGLKLRVLGGGLDAKMFVENLKQLSLEGTLHNFSLPAMAGTLTGKQLDYDGVVNGTIAAGGDLKAKGTSGYKANARLAISPGNRGVPISGVLNASYSGASGTVDLGQSYIALPNTRIDLTGSLNQQINIGLVSRNLNDFLPAVNFGAAKPMSSLPLTLQNGAATLQAQISGALSAPKIAGHAEINRFAVQQKLFDRFSLDLVAAPSGAQIHNGALMRNALVANFDGSIGLSKWQPTPRSPVAANLTLRNGNLEDLLSLAGESSIPASGQVTADIHINGTYGDPLGFANLQIANGTACSQPFDQLSAKVSLADQLITLSTLELDAAGGSLNAGGTFRHPRDSMSVGHAEFHLTSNNIQLARIVPLQRQNAGVAGLIQLSAGVAADLRNVKDQSELTISNVTADFSARALRVQNQDAGNLSGVARTNNALVSYTVNSNFAGSKIEVNGQTSLAKQYATTADAVIDNLSVEKALKIIGEGELPARGNLSANAHLRGTLQAPEANASFVLNSANVYEEPINNLAGSVRYTDTVIDIPSINLDVPAGNVKLHGLYTHPSGNLNSGSGEFHIESTAIQLAKIVHAQQAEPGLTGVLHLAADLSAGVRNLNGKPDVRVSNLNVDFSAKTLAINHRDLGDAAFVAKTAGSRVRYQIDSSIASSQIHGSGDSQLTGEYLTRANLKFSNIRYSNLAPFLSPENSTPPGFDALLEGQASVNGPVLNTDNLSARLEIDRFDIKTSPRSSPTGAPPQQSIDFQNDGPLVVTLERSTVRVNQFRIHGPRTNVAASGAISLKDSQNPLGLNLTADADLGVLQDISREFFSSGTVALNATIHGTFSQPLVNGSIELKSANINYADAPNGLSNGNGTILLNGNTATIQSLTGESGGGKVSVSGFVGLTTSVLSYNLRASATKVRTRYSGVSITSNANLSLIGNSRRSLLGGTVTIQRIAYSSSSDAGSILSTASTPPSTPTAPSPLLANMRLAIQIVTAPDVRVVTTYADRLDISATLTVRGTAASPGMLGRVNVTNGQLVFFGNSYQVNTGTISFYDPNAIQPVLNVSLETIAQGVDVLIDVSGPMNDLKLSYRSDPPLTFEQIVQLLATNTTPSDPTIAAHQPLPPQQSLSQMGESAVLGQAVANPLASRVQRVFGLTQFKIDPSVSGSNGQPSARVTLQQKIASNVTFTYITDVTQTNSEIVRVEWDLTSRLSAVALRDYNGNVSVEFFYKFKVR